MSPRIDGYSLYVAPRGGGWIIRAYRDGDDTLVHSAEGISLSAGLDEAARAIADDLSRAAA